MNKVLSIIIPSYNMENYLPQCLDSLLVDSLMKIEVIVVNDGSKDKTLEIANKYAARFPDSIRVIDKPNGNYGSCINRGLKEASGKYVKVLDADDSFDKANLDSFIDFLATSETDLVISNFVMVDEKGKVTRTYEFSTNRKGIYNFDDCEWSLFHPGFQMHAVTYKRDIFANWNYNQTEGVSYTDMEWMFLPMTKVKTVSYFNRYIYRYLVGREGQTIDASVSVKSVNQTMLVLSNMLDLYADVKRNVAESYRKYLEHRIAMKAPSLYRIILIKIADARLYTELMEFDNKIKSIYPHLYYALEKEVVKYLPFNYISYWRNNYDGKKSLLKLKLLNKLYSYLN